MTRPIIDTTIITYEVEISEDELRRRLVNEVIDGFGLRRDNGLAPGTTWQVLRGDGRKGGYRVRIRRDLSEDTTARIEAAK